MLRAFRTCDKEHLARGEDFFSAAGNYFHNCQLKNKEALGYCKRLSHDEGRADFARNLTPRLSN
jgi:hypothetical protein